MEEDILIDDSLRSGNSGRRKNGGDNLRKNGGDSLRKNEIMKKTGSRRPM